MLLNIVAAVLVVGVGTLIACAITRLVIYVREALQSQNRLDPNLSLIPTLHVGIFIIQITPHY